MNETKELWPFFISTAIIVLSIVIGQVASYVTMKVAFSMRLDHLEQDKREAHQTIKEVMETQGEMKVTLERLVTLAESTDRRLLTLESPWQTDYKQRRGNPKG